MSLTSNYGVLVVECENSYQIVAEVSSRGEALEMAANYLDVASPEDDCLAPDSFIVNRRGAAGFYTVREVLSDEDVNEYGELLAAMRRTQRAITRVGHSSLPSTQSMNMDVANYEARLAALASATKGGAR